MRGSMDGHDSSSGEEDEDPQWKSAIQSIAATTTFGSTCNGSLSTSTSTATTTARTCREDDEDYWFKPKKLKHYQIKGQKLLDEILEKTLVFVKQDIPLIEDEPEKEEGGIRLFKHSSPGIVFDRVDEVQGPRKRPKILPGSRIDEKSKEFRKKLKSVALDGVDILAAAKDACQKSLARQEAKEGAAKAKAKKEEERVAELRRIRGERWLPSIAREMQVTSIFI